MRLPVRPVSPAQPLRSAWFYCPHYRLDSLYTTSQPPENDGLWFLWIPGTTKFYGYGKAKIIGFLPSSSNRCGRKSGNQVRNCAAGSDQRRPRFRKLVPPKMKSMKRGEYLGIAIPFAHRLHSPAQNPCGKRLP